MFEVWANQENPSLRLVKAEGTPFPGANAMVNWSLLGLSAVEPGIAGAVERDGFAEVTSVVPFDPNGVFGPAGAPVGAQTQKPG